MKPLFRWTIGNVSDQGIEIFRESVFRTMRALGDEWDYAVCYNSLDAQQLDAVKGGIQGRPVELVEQTWECPVDDDPWDTKIDGVVCVDGTKVGGTMWKVCPARMRPGAHEIVMDNDVIVFRRPPQFDDFLGGDRVLMLEEPIRFYGRYDKYIPFEDRLNSGIMGFPPGYDFAAAIRDYWTSHGSLRRLTQSDEQGLLMATMIQHPQIRLKRHEVREYGAGQDPWIPGDEYAIHLVQANRTNLHRSWIEYKKRVLDSITFF